ncbi:MAG: transglycosylase SLT domain-containing protein, partial [Chlorobiales bacterium]|nr:transglycosylase SLT domain-containing protein [Chlorobiales bacterium]
DDNLFLGISLPKTQIPLELNPQVKRFTTYFSKQLHEVFQKYLKRAEIYFPMIEQIIAEEGMPPEIIYLSLVESGVNPRAHSRANATGVWQFIKSTGRLYNLQGNAWFDERQDIYKATRSSMHHLKDLYKQYGDWYLALAAYNAGPGKVNWALRRSQDKSFWGIAQLLRRETREYVPRFIAASLVAMYPEHFGFTPMNFKTPQKPDMVTVSDCIQLSTIATYSGVSLDTLKFLNPELKKETTPPGYKNYTLKVPAGTGDTVTAAIASIPEYEKQYFLVHKAIKSQPLSHIAKRYNVHPSSIKQVNGLASATVPKGKVLFIPTSAALATQTSYSPSELSDDSREQRKRLKRKSRGKQHKRTVKKHRRKSVSSAQAYRESSSSTTGSAQ